MLTDKQRQSVVLEAKSWQGTPYAEHVHLKGIGVDCGQILYAVFRACRLLPELVLPVDYSIQEATHRASTEYVSFIDRYFRDIPEAEVKPGDLVLYQLGQAIGHAAIVVEWPGYVIHAEMRHGVSGAHGTKLPAFKFAPRVFRTLKDEFCPGGF